MAPKVRIEETLPTGEKVTITLEGPQVSKTRVLQVLDMVALMGGGQRIEEDDGERESLKEKIWSFIVDRYGEGEWFSLKELHRALLDEMPELRVTTVAAYLARFVSEGRLAKKGRIPSTLYRVRTITRAARG
jgi:hypothetical protein